MGKTGKRKKRVTRVYMFLLTKTRPAVPVTTQGAVTKKEKLGQVCCPQLSRRLFCCPTAPVEGSMVRQIRCVKRRGKTRRRARNYRGKALSTQAEFLSTGQLFRLRDSNGTA